ncbi:hypothetical protein SAMN04487910_4529 [Aquimarina amphilecti]|uniref:Uncharacterized protein n=1 Tax=Aquimarina amphilecti TaxID=1038014 RepID=A0A1H7WRF9_AQUAM|nr:hypothetical protein SAMN04487910_4529 [Aquimarina amphilecti]
MKAIKTIFAVLFVSSMFIACESDSINEEVGIDELELLADEDDNTDTEVETYSSEDDNTDTEVEG